MVAASTVRACSSLSILCVHTCMASLKSCATYIIYYMHVCADSALPTARQFDCGESLLQPGHAVVGCPLSRRRKCLHDLEGQCGLSHWRLQVGVSERYDNVSHSNSPPPSSMTDALTLTRCAVTAQAHLDLLHSRPCLLRQLS